MTVHYPSFAEAYRTTLALCWTHSDKVLYGHTFVIENILRNTTPNVARAFRAEFAEKFFQWNYAGKSDPRELFDDNPNAQDFYEAEGRNTAYGPRIVAQLPAIYAELSEDLTSRRACLMILDAGDQELLGPKRRGESKMEYPCTVSLTFFINHHGLNCHACMRSNNLTTTICYDVYNFTRLQEEMAKLLNLPLGKYYHHMINGHILSKELGLARKILTEEGLVK